MAIALSKTLKRARNFHISEKEKMMSEYKGAHAKNLVIDVVVVSIGI